MIAAALLGVATAQPPTSAPTNQATGDAALNGASLDYFPRDHLFRILGKEVLSAKGEDMGRIVDVLFDEKGEPHAAVIDFGGFLGMGTRKIAISWSALAFRSRRKAERDRSRSRSRATEGRTRIQIHRSRTSQSRW